MPNGSAASAIPSATQHFADDQISFDYPAGWHARKGTVNPSGSWTLVFVGPAELPSECIENEQGGVCHAWPVMKLDPDGIIVAWRDHGMPGSTPPSGGDPTSAGARPARISRAPANEACAAIGGDESIGVVVVPTPGQMGWIGIDACLAGPNQQAGEAELASMLASATLR